MTELAEFKTAKQFRAWLRRNHRSAKDIVVRLYKVHALDQGLGYAEALDEALSYGWIDAVRHRLDEDTMSIRWCPRKPGSIWSNINVRHVARLTREGRMQAAGIAAFEKRQANRTGVYSFEQPPATLAPAFLRQFKRDQKAWQWFEKQAPSYQRRMIHWVMRGKQEETRRKRLGTLMAASRREQRL